MHINLHTKKLLLCERALALTRYPCFFLYASAQLFCLFVRVLSFYSFHKMCQHNTYIHNLFCFVLVAVYCFICTLLTYTMIFICYSLHKTHKHFNARTRTYTYTPLLNLLFLLSIKSLTHRHTVQHQFILSIIPSIYTKSNQMLDKV